MFASKEGQAVPQVTFPVRVGDAFTQVTTDDIFKDKTVILFSLPGAFTPTCSSSHLPRFNELFPVFKEHGVDEIVCVSVNDTFVMNAWKEDQEAENIRFIPDGNGDFTDGMGLLVDKKELGFGKRSWRYSMLVKNGVVEKMFIEPNEPGDPFKVSDADTMLNYIAPEYKAQESITVFTKPGCPFCAKAKQNLIDKSLQYEEVVLGKDATTVSLRAITGRSTVPQVFIGGKHIGGSEELETYLA
ncbi:glutathione peroxidase [Vibrio breoganii]|uniref:glutathione peroxidase n=1 Tax=Vibrio breoganii TaxID=553239 RepID=UPI0021C44097|nr:glutathione peroxidase [Vibrio breoganii]MDN3714596.1 glutathione peroxidase [Vibrio breoganii]